jgi:hypothetical protein
MNRENIIEVNNNDNNDRVEIKKSRIWKRENSRPCQHFSFWDSICLNCFIINRRKRNFINMISDLINQKLSVEYILELSNNFELLKRKTLTKDQCREFDEKPHLNLDEQIREFNSET